MSDPTVFLDGINTNGIGDTTLTTFAANMGAAKVAYYRALSGSNITVANQLDIITGGVAIITDPQYAGGAVSGISAPDATAAINAAILSGNYTVQFPPGGYFNVNLSELPIIVGQKVRLYSAGPCTLNCTSQAVFCTIALVENVEGVIIDGLILQASMTSEPSGPAPVRAIVVGTNSTGTAHSSTVYEANAMLENLLITGSIPGTNGYNLGVQFNLGSGCTLQGSTIESIYGKNSSFGYGAVVNGTGQKILFNNFNATIPNFGRHAIYVTDQPEQVLVQGNWASGFQDGAFVTNTEVDSPTVSDSVSIINNWAINCLRVGTGSGPQGVIELRIANSRAAGNRIAGSAFSGIIAYDRAGIEVNDNDIQNVYQWGMQFISCTNFIAHDNIIQNPDYAGTSTYSGLFLQSCSNGDVHNNQTSGTSYKYGVDLNTTVTLNSNLRIFDNPVSGTFVQDISNEFVQGSGVLVRRPTNGWMIPTWQHVGVSIPYTTFQTAGLENNIFILQLPAAGVVHGAHVRHSTQFAGTGISSVTMSVGDTSNLASCLPPFLVSQAVSGSTYAVSDTLNSWSYTATTNLYVTATSVGANLSALTAGVVDVWVLVSAITQ